MNKRDEIVRKKLIVRMEPIVKEMVGRYNSILREMVGKNPPTSADCEAALKVFEDKHVSTLRLKGDRLYAQSFLAFKQMHAKQLAGIVQQSVPKFVPKEEE